MFLPPLGPLPLAEIDIPSFSGFPWTGLALLVCFAGTAAGIIAAAVWIHSEVKQHVIRKSEFWQLGIGGLLGALVAGLMWGGPASTFLALGGLVVMLGMFTRERDRRVPPEERLLTKQALKNIRSMVAATRERRRAVAVPKAAPKSLKERLAGIGESLQSLLAMKKPKPKPVGPHFALLKKDGTPAVNTAGGDDADAKSSENIHNMQQMLLAAMNAGATDIHFEPVENKAYHVRLRVDGVLKESHALPIAQGRGLISALKVVSDMDIAERRRPQDGTFSAVLEQAKYDIRVASTPTSYGEKMVLRLLQSSGGGMLKHGLDSIGLRSQIMQQLREVIHKPYGMFLVTGPTGSGKTTTVYASLSEIDAKQHNITTIEDPVEYRLDGITQIAVNTAAGVTFAGILRSVLRQDPDVLLVGEIRDKETAEIACQSALTGHFVFSTLHANDTVATITRLLDLGLDAMLIQTAVSAVLAQRLARKLCPHCKEAYAPPSELLAKVGLKPGAVKEIYREKGCDQCGGSGYKGRIGLHELMIMNDDIRGLITDQPNIQDLKLAARKSGTRSLQLDGLLKVLKGITSTNEVIRVTT